MLQTLEHGHTLLIGVGQCQHTPFSLPVTVKDVSAIRSVLTDPNHGAYPDDEDHVRQTWRMSTSFREGPRPAAPTGTKIALSAVATRHSPLAIFK